MVFYSELRSMSGRYASYWNAFLLYSSVLFFGMHIYANVFLYYWRHGHVRQKVELVRFM